ncbi:MAG TPA: NnrU family protein [Alphaproteobacteria bacterium]
MTGSIWHLVAAAAVFVGTHFALASPGTRRALVARLGEGPFTGLYSTVAALTLLWLGLAYGNAPYRQLWPQEAWMRLVPAVVMPVATFFLICGVTQQNPTAVNRSFDRAARDPAPGVLKITRHPVMWAIGLWALAHIVPNGDLAALILFGSLAFLALFGTAQIDAKRRARDPEGFARFAEVTSNLPFAALLTGKTRRFWRTAYGKDPVKSLWREIGLARVTGALALYVALIYLHPLLTGVPLD